MNASGSQETDGSWGNDPTQENDGRLLAGRYRVGRLIGRGGMGAVWTGYDEALGRDVAMKALLPASGVTQAERDDLTRWMLREARAAGRINHPSAVTVYDAFEAEDRPWIVMQLLEGRNMSQLIKDGPLLSVRTTIGVGLDLLDALQAAHRAGVLHRDVKPANVIITRSGRAVLTDFGIARIVDETTLSHTGMFVGSPGYMSPERARGESPNRACDLWSLGATLYAAVEGVPPFRRQSQLLTLTAVINEPAPLARHAGPLGPVIAQMLAKDPAQRPDAAQTRRLLRQALALLPPEPNPAAEPNPAPGGSPAPTGSPAPAAPSPGATGRSASAPTGSAATPAGSAAAPSSSAAASAGIVVEGAQIAAASVGTAGAAEASATGASSSAALQKNSSGSDDDQAAGTDPATDQADARNSQIDTADDHGAANGAEAGPTDSGDDTADQAQVTGDSSPSAEGTEDTGDSAPSVDLVKPVAPVDEAHAETSQSAGEASASDTPGNDAAAQSTVVHETEPAPADGSTTAPGDDAEASSGTDAAVHPAEPKSGTAPESGTPDDSDTSDSDDSSENTGGTGDLDEIADPDRPASDNQDGAAGDNATAPDPAPTGSPDAVATDPRTSTSQAPRPAGAGEADGAETAAADSTADGSDHAGSSKPTTGQTGSATDQQSDLAAATSISVASDQSQSDQSQSERKPVLSPEPAAPKPAAPKPAGPPSPAARPPASEEDPKTVGGKAKAPTASTAPHRPGGDRPTATARPAQTPTAHPAPAPAPAPAPGDPEQPKSSAAPAATSPTGPELLRRRRPLVLAALAAVLVAAAALVMLQILPGSGDEEAGAAYTATSTADASSSAAPQSSSQDAATTDDSDGSTDAADDTTEEATDDQIADSGTDQTQSDDSDALPDGFGLRHDRTGFTVAIPSTWTRSTKNTSVYFKDPDSGAFLQVDTTTTPADDVLADWKSKEPYAESRFGDYTRISLKRVEYKNGWDTADWEYTWVTSSGTKLHVINRNIRVSDHRAYALVWSVPQSDWKARKPDFVTVTDSFVSAD